MLIFVYLGVTSFDVCCEATDAWYSLNLAVSWKFLCILDADKGFLHLEERTSPTELQELF